MLAAFLLSGCAQEISQNNGHPFGVVLALLASAALFGVLAVLTPTLIDAVFGVLVGALVLVLVSVAGKAWGALRA